VCRTVSGVWGGHDPYGVGVQVPRRHDTGQWRKVELIRRAGESFRGNQDWPELKTLREARDFIAGLDRERQEKWEMERHAGVERAQRRAARAKAKRRE